MADVISLEEFFTYADNAFSYDELVAFAEDNGIELPDTKMPIKKLNLYIRKNLLKQLTSEPPSENLSYPELLAIYQELGGDGDELLKIVRMEVTKKYRSVKNPKKLPPSLSSFRQSMPARLPPPSTLSTSSSSSSSKLPPSSSKLTNPRDKSPTKALVTSILNLYEQRLVIREESERDALEASIAETQASIDKLTKQYVAKIPSDPMLAKQVYDELNRVYNQLEEKNGSDAFMLISDIYGIELIKLWLEWRKQHRYYNQYLDAHYKQLVFEKGEENNDYKYHQRLPITIPLDVPWNFNQHITGSHDLIDSIMERVLAKTDIAYDVFYDNEDGLMIDLMSDEPIDSADLLAKIRQEMSHHHYHRFTYSNQYDERNISSIKETFRVKINGLIGDNLGKDIHHGVMLTDDGYLVVLLSSHKISKSIIDKLNDLLSGKIVATLRR